METLSKVFEDKYNKNVKDCTNEESITDFSPGQRIS